MPRTREFNTEQALASIKDVFWKHGYEGGSMALIEAETGLKKQSLYRAFGDKRQMYLAALRDYERLEVAAAIKMLKAPGIPAARIDGLFAAIIDAAIKNGDRRGCLLCNASVDQAPLDEDSELLVGQIMQRFSKAIEKCLSDDPQFAAAPRLRRETVHAVLAGYFGLRVMIKAGQPRTLLTNARKRLVATLL